MLASQGCCSALEGLGERGHGFMLMFVYRIVTYVIGVNLKQYKATKTTRDPLTQRQPMAAH